MRTILYQNERDERERKSDNNDHGTFQVKWFNFVRRQRKKVRPKKENKFQAKNFSNQINFQRNR